MCVCVCARVVLNQGHVIFSLFFFVTGGCTAPPMWPPATSKPGVPLHSPPESKAVCESLETIGVTGEDREDVVTRIVERGVAASADGRFSEGHFVGGPSLSSDSDNRFL